MLFIKTNTIKHITSFGGQTGHLNWLMDCHLKSGEKKKIKRDALGTYIVIDRKRNYFPKDSAINKATLWNDMKDDYNSLRS